MTGLDRSFGLADVLALDGRELWQWQLVSCVPARRPASLGHQVPEKIGDTRSAYQQKAHSPSVAVSALGMEGRTKPRARCSRTHASKPGNGSRFATNIPPITLPPETVGTTST